VTVERFVEGAARWSPHLIVASGCLGLAASLGLPARPFAWLAAPALAALAALDDGARRVLLLSLALAIGGWAWGSARLASLDRSELASRVGDVEPALLAVTGPPRRGRFDLRAPAEVRRWGRQPLHERVLLELPLERSPPQGALLEVVAEVRLPRGAEEPGGFDERRWLRRQGIHVVLRGQHARIVGYRGGFWGFADRLRAWLARSLAPGVTGERHAVLEGVVLGADEGLSDGLRSDFRASGLYHLLAVSGQNVTFISLGILGLAWLLTIPRWLGELAALASIAAYVLAVGLQPSVVRAGVAGALASLAWLAARPRDRWYFLLAGAAALLAWNPYSLADPGFQLSFSAVAAIFLVVPRLEAFLAGYPVPTRIATMLAVSAACSLATAPVLLLQFGTVPTYSVPANAFAEPVVGPLLGLGLVTAILGTVLPPAAAGLAWVNGWLAAYLAACARVAGGLPGAQVSSLHALLPPMCGALFLLALARMRPPRLPKAIALGGAVLAVIVLWHLRPGVAGLATMLARDVRPAAARADLPVDRRRSAEDRSRARAPPSPLRRRCGRAPVGS
jgi:competence protein ComEC